MKNKIFCFSLFFVLVFNHTVISQTFYKGTQKTHTKNYNESQSIATQIKNSFEDIKGEQQPEIEGNKLFSSEVLPEFYYNRDFRPAWSDYSAFVDALNGLENSFHDGLNPEDYHASKINDIVKKLNDNLQEGEIDYNIIAHLDILLTDAVLLYAYHLLEGKVNPETLDANWNYSFKEIQDDAPYKLERAVETASVSSELKMLRPDNRTYGMTMEKLNFYREVEKSGRWEKIPDGKTIHAGDDDERIPLIRKRLSVTKELSELSNLGSSNFDSILVQDVKDFQFRNGLKPDGVIGSGTVEILNVSVEDRINTLRVNLERNRWIDSDLTENYIIVNIAAFKAYYMVNHQPRFLTNVQVGKTYTKTPVFKDRLRYIEFNPTWTVPVSIIGKSIIPKMKKDPNYIAKNNFELIDRSGKIISQSEINVDNLSIRNFHYTVRQKPGKHNALGEVKFIFPNKHSVYLHDTPSKSLFENEERAFSHGCIRTQNPLDLAEVLLEGSEWNSAKIDSVIQTRKTLRVFPEKDIDVLLMYWTAGYLENEGFGFFRDVYDRDEKLLIQLNKTGVTQMSSH